jgi:hypothetical protein
MFGSVGDFMRREIITDEQIMLALCCGVKCERGKGYCHRWDFETEAKRIGALLDKFDSGEYADGNFVPHTPLERPTTPPPHPSKD